MHESVQKRYGELAEKTCCLSCGGAANKVKITEGEKCADLGCGRGNDTLKMAGKAGAEGFAYGIDITDKMLETARRQAEKLGVANAAFIKAPLDSTGLPGSCLDAAISNCTINHAPDKDAVWREIYRILKPGGRFCVSDIYSIGAVPAEYKNDPDAVAECWAGAVEKDEYLDTLERAGFSDIRILEESEPYDKGKIQVASFTVWGRKGESGE